MDINNSLNKIENYKAAIAERAAQERVAAKHHHTQLLDQIWVMKTDIDNLIKVANAAREAGIPIQVKFPNTNFTYENGDFIADAMTHKIGFIPSSLTSERIIGVGFEGGGYCGNYDFFTDGQAILDRNHDNGCEKPASTEHLEKFIEKFPEFERAFYDYIGQKTDHKTTPQEEGEVYYIEIYDKEDGETIFESDWMTKKKAEKYGVRLLKAVGDEDDYDVEFVKDL